METAGASSHHVGAGEEPVTMATEDASPIPSPSTPQSEVAGTGSPTSMDTSASIIDDHKIADSTPSVEELEMPSDSEDKSAASMSDSFEHLSIPESLYEKDTPTSTETEKDSPSESTEEKSSVMDVIGNGKIVKTVSMLLKHFCRKTAT